MPKVLCAWLPNEREAMSAISFAIPAMDWMMSGEALFARRRMDNAATIRCATFDLVDLSLLVQPTVGVLSDHAAMCSCLSESTICSRTNQCRRRAAISRSEFVIPPVGFAAEQNSSCTVVGHSMRQTVGCRYLVPLNHTPPAPLLAASQKPM